MPIGTQANGETGTITRVLGAVMPNGESVEFPMEYWIFGIWSILSPHEKNEMVSFMRKLPPFHVKSLGDGMGVISKPINGIILPGG